MACWRCYGASVSCSRLRVSQLDQAGRSNAAAAAAPAAAAATRRSGAGRGDRVQLVPEGPCTNPAEAGPTPTELRGWCPSGKPDQGHRALQCAGACVRASRAAKVLGHLCQLQQAWRLQPWRVRSCCLISISKRARAAPTAGGHGCCNNNGCAAFACY